MSRRSGYKCRWRRTALEIQQGLAPLVQRLEDAAPKIVSLEQLAAYIRELGIERAPKEVAQDLRLLGTLLPLRTRERWEFIPIARGRVFRSEDPFIELRATLQRRDLPIALAFDSAVYAHGLSTWPPARHVLAGYPLLGRMPAALDDFRIAAVDVEIPPELIDGLPVWRMPTLLAQVAITPHNLYDWAAVPDWLKIAFERTDPADLEKAMCRADANARFRLAYLADRVGLDELAQTLTHGISTRSVTYLGAQNARGHYSQKYTLVDSLLPATQGVR